MFNIPGEIEKVINKLNTEGYEAYLVGGCVRDILLGRKPNDYDICTNAKAEEVIGMFDKVIPVGQQYGIVKVVVGKYIIDVAEMVGGSLEKDLSRRDFTINALAFNYKYDLFDYCGGFKDLNNRVIKTVGNPDDRFREDPLRMIRCKRFGCQLEFGTEEKTGKSIIRNSKLITKVSAERVREEICKILLSNHPGYGITWLYHWNILKYIIPELCDCYGFEQHSKYHNKDVFKHTMTVLDETSPRLNLRLGALFHDIAKPVCFSVDNEGRGHFYKHHTIGAEMTGEILVRLKFDNNTIESVTKLVKYHMDRYTDIKDSGIKKLINRVGKENIEDLFELQTADIKGCKPPLDFSYVEEIRDRANEVLRKVEPLSVKELDINGRDLIKIGIEPGKRMGEILRELLEIVLEKPEINEKKKLIEIVKREFNRGRVNVRN